MRLSDFWILAVYRGANSGLESGRPVPRYPTESVASVRSILYRVASVWPGKLPFRDRVTRCCSEFSHSDIPSLIVAS